MSTDYYAGCVTCRRVAHLGVRFTSGWAFGNGSNDVEGRRFAGEWILEHMHEGHDVRIFVSDDRTIDDFDYDKPEPRVES